MNHLAASFGIGLVAFIFLFALLCLALPLIIGLLVYRDAKDQAMDPPILWALVSALAPSFIGLIIYVVIRCTRK